MLKKEFIIISLAITAIVIELIMIGFIPLSENLKDGIRNKSRIITAAAAVRG